MPVKLVFGIVYNIAYVIFVNIAQVSASAILYVLRILRLMPFFCVLRGFCVRTCIYITHAPKTSYAKDA